MPEYAAAPPLNGLTPLQYVRSLVGGIMPEDNGLIAWSSNPSVTSSSQKLASGNLYLTLMYIPKTVVSNISIWINTAGASLTTGENFIGIYDPVSTNLFATSVDATTAFETANDVTVPLSSPYQIPSAGLYYIGILSNGTTGPTLARGAAAPVPNIGNPSYPLAAISNTTYTTLPTSIPADTASGTYFAIGIS
jgi:hypothetical protein